MTDDKSPPPDAALAAGRRPGDTPRARTCLRCEAVFESGWSGERICPGCKRSPLWRGGLPLGSRSGSRR